MPRRVETKVVDTAESVASLVDWLVRIHNSREDDDFSSLLYQPAIYIDLEGVNLCRHGSISIFTLMVDIGLPVQRVYLIDIHVLAAKAFTTPGTESRTTLKDILEDKDMIKVFFDVRNDSDALFAHYGIALQGIDDIQLMESATRETTASRKYLSGLSKCVEKNMIMWFGPGQDLKEWKEAKEQGERLFNPQQGGTYEVFNERPIPDAIMKYCAGDVRCLREVHYNINRARAYVWRDLYRDATKARVASTHAPDYQPHGQHKALAPWTDEQNKVLDSMNYKPPARDYFADSDDYDPDEEDDWDIRDYNDYEDWTRAPWQGPPS